MEMCLYYPGLGYYTAAQDRIGTNGDFYTSVTLTPAFGISIAKQIEEMWHHLGEGVFTIVEYGGGGGDLCRAILSALKNNKELYEQLQYRIIEKCGIKDRDNNRRLHEKVTWHHCIDEFTMTKGCILSNELLDNFPVHQVVMEDELMEVFVDFQNGFVETTRPAGQPLIDYFLELNIELPKGFRAEISLRVISWIQELANAMKQGYLITIDYGYTLAEFYKPHRSRGTLLAYYQHSVSDDLYNHIGQQDITAHVNFSALSHWGRKNGLTDCGFTDQCHFLLSLGAPDIIKRIMEEKADVVTAARKAALLNYTLLMDMGYKFKVLIQEKGGCNKDLCGLSVLRPDTKKQG